MRVRLAHRPAVIGSLDRIEAMANGSAGTRVVCA
ncbi:carbamate kinase [Paraburkholderia bryophila]|uniref:Carbamate kinase n=1 Tax=Paraburkholderia bryophila TaxID=420952 RepID=A0A7Y9W4N7_9BURK|nr:carbamate kinase [Paraburkholderia bryophila]